MKSPLLIAALSVCLTAPLWAQSDDSSDSSSTPAASGSGQHHHWGGPGGDLTPDQRAELKAARESAFQANPDLKTEGEKLRQEMQDYQQKLHDAMVKADPKVGPLLKKFGHHGPPPGDDGGGNN